MDYPTPNDPELMYDGAPTEYVDMAAVTPTAHRFEQIVGNELRCTLHGDGNCPVLFIKPTEVLEGNEAGELELVDKLR